MPRQIFSHRQNILYIAILTAMFFLAFIILPASVQAASYERSPEVKQWTLDSSSNYTVDQQFYAYDQGFTGGGSIAVDDFGVDGVDEIVTGAGYGGSPHVRVFQQDGSFISQFFAYDETMRAGVNVAAGDIDNDGKAEIVTAPKEGGAPHVRVFDSSGKIEHTVGFYAYDEGYTGGVNVAVGDVNGDGKDDIITGNGVNGASHVRVFTADGTPYGNDIRPFAEDLRGGVSVAVGNVDGGDEEEIIVAVQDEDEAYVKVYKFNDEKTIIAEWRAYDEGFKGGINVAAGDVDGDGMAEIVLTPHGRGGPQVRVFEAYGMEINPGFFAYEEDFHGGVNLAVGANATSAPIYTIPSKARPDEERYKHEARYVIVDISDQELVAYENGYEVRRFLVSTGLPGTPTPIGEYRIQRKLYSHLYAGEGFYFPNTLYNLQFFPHYYLHGAYWHNNFGNPMSHGCVNIAYEDAEWLYGWMLDGDLTVTQY